MTSLVDVLTGDASAQILNVWAQAIIWILIDDDDLNG
jgi:hypothetical protein